MVLSKKEKEEYEFEAKSIEIMSRIIFSACLVLVTFLIVLSSVTHVDLVGLFIFEVIIAIAMFLVLFRHNKWDSKWSRRMYKSQKPKRKGKSKSR